MLVEHTPHWFATLVMTGALAAFMSTLDSQLLALSTISTQDIYLPLQKKTVPLKTQVRIGQNPCYSIRPDWVGYCLAAF